MPTALKLFGFKFYYWAREHKPIHIHVQKAGAEARFVIDPEVELIENTGLKPHELALAEEIICENREYLVEHWKLFFKEMKNENN
ncbi:MAG: DUF4160 domain-containing protein [Prevotellaceae bacterium]|jgi:hypothetical protein|nr:DUF4160 domain-containing protein [Prevotellaceae bacterium]